MKFGISEFVILAVTTERFVEDTVSMNIVHVIGSLGAAAGGPSRTVPSLCASIQPQLSNGKISILTGISSEFGENLTNKQLLIRELPAASATRTWIAHLSQMVMGLNHESAIIHDHGQWLRCNRAAAVVARRMAVPRVVTPRGMLSPWALAQGRWKKKAAWNLFAKRYLERADVIHATSELEADELRSLGTRRPIAVIANGVEVWRALIPPPKKRQVVFLSRIHPKKGLVELVKAWRESELSGWKLIIAGPDEAGIIPGLRIGSNENIAYVGEKAGDAKWTLLSESSLFILPTYSENFGVVVAEALMAGTPVITTHHAPWHGLVEENCGWWIPMNEHSIRSTLGQATSLNIETLAEMGQRGRDFALREFGWPQIGAEMVRVYQWILSGGATPACIRY